MANQSKNQSYILSVVWPSNIYYYSKKATAQGKQSSGQVARSCECGCGEHSLHQLGCHKLESYCLLNTLLWFVDPPLDGGIESKVQPLSTSFCDRQHDKDHNVTVEQFTNHQTLSSPRHAVVGDYDHNRGHGRSYAKEFYSFCNFFWLMSRAKTVTNRPPFVSESLEKIGLSAHGGRG